MSFRAGWERRAPVPASSTAAASALGTVRSSLRTSSGPASWPTANAAVMAATRRLAPGVRSWAACMAASVATMNVPPTVTAETATAGRPAHTTGASTPAAMTAWAQAQTRSGPWRRTSGPAASVDAAAATPKTGHVQPKTAGSEVSARAAAGRKVAGRM